MFKLEQEGKNDVWLSILRNAFAPILKGKFDYVVGNPPWVNWENLPEEYIEVSKSLWEYYGLAEMKGKVGLGKVKRDLAMLFLVRSLDLYLKEGGKLGFLMPFTAFKVQAGAGFRSFLAKKTKIHVVHDLVTLYPFGRSKKGAVNRTSAIVVEKICEVDSNKIPDKAKDVCMKALEKAYEENMNGVKHIIWDNPTRNPIPLDKPLEEVLRETKRYEAIMLPLKPGDPGSPWMQIIPKAVNVVRKLLTGTQYYKAYEGVNVALNQVYHIRIKGKTPDGKLIITNPPEPRNKKKVKQVEAIIEPDLVYPLIIGDDINRWHVEFKERYIILPVDLQGNSIKPQDMKIKYPNTYNYFSNYFNELVNRGGEPYKSKLRPYREKPLEYAEKIAPPFYWVFNAKPSLAPYKVAWKYVSGEIKGKGEFSCTVIGIIEDKFLGNKIAIPNEKVMIVPLYSEDEAYYLCGILNSTIVRAIVASYTIETEISTHILENIRPPKFNPANELHRKIAELSRRAHELAKCIYAEKKPDYCRGIDAEQELKNVEREIDLAVAQLFGLSEDDVREFKKLMAILSGEELLEEEVVEVPKEPSVTVLNTLIPPNTESYIEVEVVNPSGEEISIVYEFPWGKGSFSIVEGRQRIRVPPLSPGKYSGVVKYVWCGVEKVINVVVEVSDVSGPKRQRRLVS
jgi:type II restriction/modification system DNA methylase subunit YeeA